MDFDTLSVDGSDNLTQTILDLLNAYPKLSGRKIEFAKLDTTIGIAMFPLEGVAILTERVDVTGHVTQKCAYPFRIVYRTRAAAGKENIKEWLDDLGRFLELQPIKVGDEEIKLVSYPELDGDRRFDKISRTQQGTLAGTTADKAEDWTITIQAQYWNEFDK